MPNCAHRVITGTVQVMSAAVAVARWCGTPRHIARTYVGSFIQLPGRVKLYQSRAWLRRKWEVEKLSEGEIAKLAGTTQVTVNRYLRHFGLKKER
jgi:hypothetical protein